MGTRRGFTLIEMLVVISIIVLLVGLLLPVLTRARLSARNTATKTTIHNLNIALDNYKLDWKQYPIVPGGSNAIYDTGSGSYNPGYFQSPCAAKGAKASGVEDNKDLVKLLLDTKFLDIKRANLNNGQLLDHFNTPLIVRFLVSKAPVGDVKISEKTYIWSYGSDTTNGVNAKNAYVCVGLPDYDKGEIDNVENSGADGADDLTNWR